MVCGRKYANHSPNKDSIIESQSFNLDYGVYAVSMRYELLQWFKIGHKKNKHFH